MLAVSLKTQLEKAIAASEGVKHLEGNIKSTAELFAPGALVLLEDRFRAFAFLAFDPAVDNAFADYVRGGGMGSDSGPNILALFLLDQEATWPVQVDHASFNGWLDIDSTIHPSHQVLRFLFEPEEVPPLPGIAILRTFTLKSEAIYVPCVGCGNANDVRAQCRRIFSLVDLAARDDRASASNFVARVSVALRRERLEFQSTAPTSGREWIVRTYQFLGDHVGDLVSIAGLAL